MARVSCRLLRVSRQFNLVKAVGVAAVFSSSGASRDFEIAATDRLIYLAAMDWNLFRSFDAQPHLVSADLNDNDANVVVDDNAFVFSAREYEHGIVLGCPGQARPTHECFAFRNNQNVRK